MLKLVSNNNISTSYFSDYEDAINFLCDSSPKKFKNMKYLSQQGAVNLMNKLCDENIGIVEKDNGDSYYKVRIEI